MCIRDRIIGHTEVLVRAKNETGLSVSQRFDVEVIQGDNNNAEDALSVYPNPVRTDLTITLQPEVRGKVVLKLYNVAGRLMKIEEGMVGDAGYKLDMSGMQAGSYVLVVEGNGISWKKSIIKI